MPDQKRMGYEDKLFHGTAGSQASTRVDRAKDLNYTGGVDRVETNDRGDSSGPPIDEQDVVKINPQVTWTMAEKDNDSSLAALIAAADSGAAIAIAYKRASTGKGFDGDCTLDYTEAGTLGGAKEYSFTAVPTSKGGRAPSLNATISAT